jgi:hypothetical protein
MALTHHIHLEQLKLVSLPTIASAHVVLTLLDISYLPRVPTAAAASYLSFVLSAFRHHYLVHHHYPACLNEIHVLVDCGSPGLNPYSEFASASYIVYLKNTVDF